MEKSDHVEANLGLCQLGGYYPTRFMRSHRAIHDSVSQQVRHIALLSPLAFFVFATLALATQPEHLLDVSAHVG